MRRGLTLIELLVAVIVSGIVAFIALEMLEGEQQNYTRTREKVRLQTDAREGMRILEEEIKNAGYRTSAAINATNRELTASNCAQALYASDASFDPSPSPTIYDGKAGFEIRFYAPTGSNTTLNCATDVWTVGYKYDASAKTLYRQAKKGDPAVAANALTATGWVPFMEGVSALNLRYGVLQERAALFTAPASMATTAGSDWYPSTSTPIDFASSTGSQWVVTNTTASAMTLVFTKVPLTSSGGSAAVDGARVDPLDDNASYRFSFNVSASDDFFDATSGLASVTTGTTSKFIECGFFDASGTPVSTFTFRPVPNSVVHAVQHDLVPASASASKLFFGIRFQLKGASATPRKLTISSLSIVRMNKGKYAFTSTTPASAERKKIQAIGVQTTVESKNETLTFDRIIPMVNNGL